MIDKKPLNPMRNWKGKLKDQFDEKPLNSIGDWEGKLEDQ